VVFTVMGTEREDLADLPETWKKTYPRIGYNKSRPGTREFMGREEVAPREGEPVLLKRSAGAFASTDLDLLLRGRGLDTLVITGVESDCCIYNTAVEANDRGYKTIVLEDATTTLTRTGHKTMLRAYGEIFFVNVRTTDQVLQELEKALAPRPSLVPPGR